MNENKTAGRELGWDDTIENDGPDFILLPEGDYDFTVAGFERGRHGGSDKLPPCNKATLSIKIEAPEGDVTLRHNLYMHTTTEGLLCAFFTAIGQRRHGERFTMNWNAVVGTKGRCKVGVRTYKSSKSGEDVTINEIKKFYEPALTPPAAPGTYTAGQF